MPVHHIPPGDDPPFQQLRFDIFYLDKAQELLTVFLLDVRVRVSGYGGDITEMVSHVKAIVDVAVRLIAHARVVVQIQIVDAPIVGGQGGDQAGLLLLLLLLGEQLLLEL